MKLKRRIYVSMPADGWFPEHDKLKWAIVDELIKDKYLPEIFLNPRFEPGIASGEPWNAERALALAKRCVGAVIIGFPRWKFRDADNNEVLMPSEFNAYEGAIAHSLNLPMLVIAHKNVVQRTVLHSSYGHYISEYNGTDGVPWLEKPVFQTPYKYWKKKLAHKRDVFLGYCGKKTGTAAKIKSLLEDELNISVLDWQTDFPAGNNILDQIKDAAKRCSVGIFLFTNDDEFSKAEDDGQSIAAPRDNVIFESGFFIHAKGKNNVLIIREHGAKYPADLGGDIYISLNKKNDVEKIEKRIKHFFKSFNSRPLL